MHFFITLLSSKVPLKNFTSFDFYLPAFKSLFGYIGEKNGILSGTTNFY